MLASLQRYFIIDVYICMYVYMLLWLDSTPKHKLPHSTTHKRNSGAHYIFYVYYSRLIVAVKGADIARAQIRRG